MCEVDCFLESGFSVFQSVLPAADECGLHICQDGICIRPIVYGSTCDSSGTQHQPQQGLQHTSKHVTSSCCTAALVALVHACIHWLSLSCASQTT